MRVMALVLFLVAGCGSGSETPACPPPLVGSCTNHTGFFCTEYSGLATDGGAGLPGAETLMATCKGDPDEPDTWSSSGCSHAGALGACRRMQQGLCVAVWLKVPVADSNTRAQAISMCAAQGGTWVEP